MAHTAGDTRCRPAPGAAQSRSSQPEARRPAYWPAKPRASARLLGRAAVVIGSAAWALPGLAATASASPADPASSRPDTSAYPRFSELSEISGLGTSARGFFGTSVAVSGTTLVVGAPELSGGRAYVFNETPAGWAQVALLKGTDTQPGDSFGTSVAVSDTTIVVGASGHADGSGRAYVFTKGAGGWRQADELAAPEAGPGAGFGASVAVSGATIVVGSPYADLFSGGAYVFRETGGDWYPAAELVTGDTFVEDNFGYSVAVSGDKVVVGAPGHLLYAGRAYIFSQAAPGWRQVAELKGTDTVGGDSFGYSVAISGATVVAGASSHDDQAGAAYVFSQATRGWHQVAELRGTDTVAGDDFGCSVAISGATVVVGAPDHASSAGRAYVFSRAGDGWRQAAELGGPNAVAGDNFGSAAAIGRAIVAIGAIGHAEGDGAAYVSQELLPPSVPALKARRGAERLS